MISKSDELRRRLIVKFLDVCEGEHLFKNCITCVNFDRKKELCKLANLRPPAEVIAYGCPQYISEDEIPF